MAHRARRQTSLPHERCVVRVESLCRELAESGSPEVGPDHVRDEPSVLACRCRRQLILDVFEPPRQQLSQCCGRRGDLAGRHLGDQSGERPLSLSLGARVHAAELLGATRCSVERQLDDELPVAWATLSQCPLRMTHPGPESWIDLGCDCHSSATLDGKDQSSWCYVEPRIGIEPTTYALRMRGKSSTPSVSVREIRPEQVFRPHRVVLISVGENI